MKYYLLSILIIIFTGCNSKNDYILFNQAEKSQSKEVLKPSNIQFEYKIVPHDRISVMIYKHPELSTSNPNSTQQEKGLLVNSKGFIRLPLVTKIHISGLTQTEAEDKISTAFQTYLKYPDVQVEVLNKRAYIVGEVHKPGEIPLENEQLTLFQTIALAGNLTDVANRKSILIFKSGDTNNIRTRTVNLTDKNSLLTANLMIEPNDVVYVMPNDMGIFNKNIAEISPLLNLIGNILNPFVTIKYLSE